MYSEQKGELNLGFFDSLGKSEPMQQLFSVIRKVAKTQSTILVRGESGTGKELVARAIHYNSPRAKKPLIEISCASFPETLLESELFGYEKGAFTGAEVKKKAGLSWQRAARFFWTRSGTFLKACR